MKMIKYIVLATISAVTIAVIAFEKIMAWVDKLSEREENSDAD